MENSLISWCHDTANLWIGCMKVHEGCDNCYAEALDKRWKGGHWGGSANRKMVNSVWDSLKRFQKIAEQTGENRRVFVGSMMDVFEKPYPVEDSKGNLIAGLTTGDIRDRFFNDVVPNSPNLQFLLLTKRPGNIKKYVPKAWLTTPPDNVIYGTSAVNQQTANDLIGKLLDVPGRHFISAEPLLGPISFRWAAWHDYKFCEGTSNEYDGFKGIDWVIVGGESGHSARVMQPEWAQQIRDECLEAGVPFHFKQWGQHEPDIFGQMHRVQKKSHDALLDGVEYKGFPVEITA